MLEKKVIELLNDRQQKLYNETKQWIDNLPLGILNLVQEYETVAVGRKTVVCTAIMTSGFEVTAYSSPISILDFNMDLGRILAKRKVLEEIMVLERYHKIASTTYESILKSPEIISDGNGYDVADEVIGSTTSVE